MFKSVLYLDVADRKGGLVEVRSLVEVDDRTRLSLVSSSGHEIALEEDGFDTVIFPLAGRIFCATASQDLEAGAGDALILPRGRRRTQTRPATDSPFRAVVLLVPVGRSDLRPTVVQTGALPRLADLRDLVLSRCDANRRLADAEMLATLVRSDLLRGPDEVARDRAPRKSLRRAEDLLHECYTEEISIAEVAQAAGLTPRRLQELFRLHLGTTPHAYLTRLRLEAAHRDLKAPRPMATVTQAALDNGLRHLGRFSQTYRDRFGVLPSVTRTMAEGGGGPVSPS